MKAYTLKKRIGALTLALAMCIGMLAGCGQTEPAPEPAPEPEQTEPAPEPTPEPTLPTMEDEFGNGAVGTNCAVTSADP